MSYGVLFFWAIPNWHQIGHKVFRIKSSKNKLLTGVRVTLTHFCKSLSPAGEMEFSRLLFRFSPRARSPPLYLPPSTKRRAGLPGYIYKCHFPEKSWFRGGEKKVKYFKILYFYFTKLLCNITVMGHVFLFSKGWKNRKWN